MDAHSHREHEINLVHAGAGRYRLPGRGEVALAPGTVLFLPGGAAHALDVRERLRMRIILFAPECFSGIIDGSDWALRQRFQDTRGALFFRSFANPALFDSLEEIALRAVGEDAARRPGRTDALGALGSLAVIDILRACAGPERPSSNSANARVLAVCSWIDRHPEEEASLAELAARANLSPSQFSHLFRRATGLPPGRYRLRRRIELAERLLAGTDLSVLDISLSAGFNHLAHFNRLFKERTRLTPTAYRKKHQKVRKILQDRNRPKP